MAEEENELWAQTIFTITPQANGVLREIKEETQISGSPDIKFELVPKDIVQVKNIIGSAKHFIDPAELSRIPYAEAECQTYIQDVHKVHIPIELINEATQTFYIGNQCQVANAIKEVIAAISKKSIPLLKTGQICQTIITFDKEYPQEIIIEELFTNITKEHKDPDIVVTASNEEIREIEAWHSVNHAVERAFWISDPEEPIKETESAETQTTIICNSKTGKAIYDQETQTGLTCKPKDSNSELLSSYLQTKNLAKSCLEDCLANGVYNRIIVDDILDEVLDNCCQEIHLPFLDNATQTLASCKTLEGRDEDILRKLRRPFAVDPEESKAVIVPLTEEIIKATFTQVSKDAEAVVKNMVCVLIRKSVLIAKQLEESRKQPEPKTMDHVFIQRKRKLAQSRRKKPETETASTQTKLAGVPKVEKLKEPLEVLCSVCATESECRWCSGSQEDIKLPEEKKILRTQDILLAYRPCYIRTTPKEAKIYNLQSVQVSKKDIKMTETCSKSSLSKSTSSDSSKSDKRVEPERRILCRKISPSGWSDVDLPPSKLWSLQDSRSVCGPPFKKSTNRISSKSASKISSKSESKNGSKSQSDLPPQEATALKILKSAFCTRETCPGEDENQEIDSVTLSEGNEEMYESRPRNQIQKRSVKSSNGTFSKTVPFRN